LTWGTLEAFARAIDAKSPWTAGHSERVTTMSMRIAKQVGHSDSELEVLRRGALLHDIGKLGISVKLLDKPGRLEDDEIQQVMNHPSIGGRILQPITAFADILPIVEQHHEKFNGSGYPKKLAGDEIDINARILAVADTYDAMTSDRPYRKGFDHEKAVDLILEETGMQFDPRVLRAFMTVIGEDPARVPDWTDEDALRDVAGGHA
ncbi:MAG: HD-GYP domain-containing protein, partial [Acidobacteriota bacterium]|nr:HD-GYP domain-containing protein [Acidobacteriota bacterium]